MAYDSSGAFLASPDSWQVQTGGQNRVAGIDPAELQSKYGWDPKTFYSMIQNYDDKRQDAFAGDPNVAKLIEQGFLSPDQRTDDPNMYLKINNNMMPSSSATGMPAAFFQTPPKSGATMANPNLRWNDPIYGDITDSRNILHNDRNWLDTIGPMIPMLAMGLPAMLQGGGLGSLFSGAGPGSSMARAGSGIVKGLGEGQGFNPMSLLGGAAGAFGGSLGLPEGMGSFISPVMQMLQGRGLNPIQIAMALAKQGGR